MNSPFLYSQNDMNKHVRKATILSAACPGLGQLYNEKYWKIPIIYTALGTTMYYYFENNNLYNQYKNDYIAETDNNTNTINNSNYTSSQLITLQDYYRDSRDVSTLLFILIYSLNIVDACVDAHFTDYNISDNLSLYLKPTKTNTHETLTLCLKVNL